MFVLNILPIPALLSIRKAILIKLSETQNLIQLINHFCRNVNYDFSKNENKVKIKYNDTQRSETHIVP